MEVKADRVKGVYPYKNGRFRVFRYDKHIGIFDSYEEAVKAVSEYEEYYEIEKYLYIYEDTKEWLEKRGLLPDGN